MQSFISVLKEIGSPVEKLLEQSKLSASCFEQGSIFIPEVNAWKFLDIAANTQGLENFGLLATQNVALSEFGGLGENVFNTSSLYEALNVFLSEVEAHTPNIGKAKNEPYFWLVEQQDSIMFYRRGLSIDLAGGWQAELHTLTLMINIIRLAAGENWYPKKVWLQMNNSVADIAKQAFLDANIYYDQPYSALEFPKTFFSLQNQTFGKLTSDTSHAVSVASVVQNFILHSNKFEHIDINNIAYSLNMSSRSLQRLLKEEATNFRALVDGERFKVAKSLLSLEGEKIQTIALQLGYQDPSHFVRAFKRWSGLTPTEYRIYLRN